MMGRHHVLTGVLAGIGVALVATGTAEPAQSAVLVLACGGAAVLPDLDEPGSSAAHLAGPLTELVSWATGKLSGGHRHATHSLLGAAAFAGVIALVVMFAGELGVAILAGLLAAFAWRVGGPPFMRHGVVLLAVAGGIGYLAYHYPLGYALVAAAGVGYLVHLVGDMATAGGVPLLWPSTRHYAFPVLGHTDSKRETVVSLALLVLIGFLVWHYYAPTVLQHIHSTS